MTAGRGIVHAEYNPSKDQPAHLMQFWILPRTRDISRAGNRSSSRRRSGGGLLPVVSSGDGARHAGDRPGRDDLRLAARGRPAVTHDAAGATARVPVRDRRRRDGERDAARGG